MTAMLNDFEQRMAQMQASHAERIQLLHADNEELRARLQEQHTPGETRVPTPVGPATANGQTGVATPEIPVWFQAYLQVQQQPREPPRRMIMPDPPRFDGSDSRLFSAFEMAINAKFLADGWAFSTPQLRVEYIFSRLEGLAQKEASNIRLAAQRQGRGETEEGFRSALRERYQDTEQARRALDKISHWKRGKWQ